MMLYDPISLTALYGLWDGGRVASGRQIIGPIWPVDTLGLRRSSSSSFFFLVAPIFRNWKSHPGFWIFWKHQKIWQLWAYILMWSYLAGTSSGCPKLHVIPTWPWHSFTLSCANSDLLSLLELGRDQNSQAFSWWLKTPVTQTEETWLWLAEVAKVHVYVDSISAS